MRCVELVKKGHARPLQGFHDANISVVDLSCEAFVAGNHVVDGVKEVRLIVVSFTFGQIEVAIVDRIAKQLKIHGKACVQSRQATKTRIVRHATADLTIQNSPWHDCRFVHQSVNKASQAVFFFDLFCRSITRQENFISVGNECWILKIYFRVI